jgi:hypothetical protein
LKVWALGMAVGVEANWALQVSKAIVKQLLDPLFLRRLCDAPMKELAVSRPGVLILSKSH